MAVLLDLLYFFRLFLELKPSELYVDFVDLPAAKPALPCENFRRTYAALCDLYKYPFRDEVGWVSNVLVVKRHDTDGTLDH